MLKIHFTWSDFDKAMNLLTTMLREEEFESIYGIPRGGLIPAVALSHRTNKPLVTTPLRDSLVVDDISDTGKTLSNLAKFVTLIATIHIEDNTITRPKYWCHVKPPGSWVVYPWEFPDPGWANLCSGIRFNHTSGILECQGKITGTHLTPTELALAASLVSRRGNAVSYEELLQDTRIRTVQRLGTVMYRLRTKLERLGMNPDTIYTVQSYGYGLNDETEEKTHA